MKKRTSALALFAKASLAENYLTLAAEISEDDYYTIGRQLSRIGECSQWWIGDWLNAGRDGYGDLTARCKRAGIEYHTGAGYA